MDISTEKKLAAGLSITSNTLIIIFKLIAGFISGSISIISEAIHSLSDCLASIITFFAVSRSSKPADKDHPFGHGRYEDMAGFIEGGLIIFAGFYIIYEAAKKILNANLIEFDSTLGIIVMAISIIANILVSKYLFNVAKKSDSVSLYADAKHLSTDVYSSVGVLMGLVLIKVTGIVLIDPIIAIIVATIILRAGFSISKSTLNTLLDGTISNEDMTKIETILNNCSKIQGYKNLKGRKSGSSRDIDITLLFEEHMTIKDCHNICDEIEEQIKKVLGQTLITIHCEPSIHCSNKIHENK